MSRLTEKMDNEKLLEAGIRYLTRNQDGIYAVLNKLGELEDLEEQGRLIVDWIPCSERLPRRNADVLVYRHGMAMPIIVDRYEGYYGEDDNEWYEGWAYSRNCDVIAWMPLPEPYKLAELKESED